MAKRILKTPVYGTKKEAEYAIGKLKLISKSYYRFKIVKRDNSYQVFYHSKNKSDYLSNKELFKMLERHSKSRKNET